MVIKKILAFVLLILVIGFSIAVFVSNQKTRAWTALKNADHITLFSIEPREYKAQDKENFYSYAFLGGKPKLLGTVEIAPEGKQAVIDEVFAIQKNWDNTMAACFEPRHAVQVKTDKNIYDFIICYGCSRMVVYEDQKKIEEIGITGAPDYFNRLFLSRNIPYSTPDN